MTRIWELRDNLTPYDAAYVALAEALEAATYPPTLAYRVSEVVSLPT